MVKKSRRAVSHSSSQEVSKNRKVCFSRVNVHVLKFSGRSEGSHGGCERRGNRGSGIGNRGEPKGSSSFEHNDRFSLLGWRILVDLEAFSETKEMIGVGEALKTITSFRGLT
jgi:hypothetical protein